MPDEVSMKKYWDMEETYLKEDRKEEKRRKKREQQKDRSKYKKTDLEKQQKKEVPTEGLKKGRVLSILPQGIYVECEGKEYICTLKGSLKQEKNKIKNLVTVGDLVYFDKAPDQEGVIAHVAARKSYLSRKDHLLKRQEQLIAANVDILFITASVSSPHIRPALIDRYIIAAKKGGMQPMIVINKIDFLNEEEKPIVDEISKVYPALGIPVFLVSCKTKEGLSALQEAMKEKISVFSGQSGTGKSSLIMEMTGKNLAIGTIIRKTQKGTHTTSTTSLLPLPLGGFVIDTPGIRSFGVWDLQKEEVEAYFDEIFHEKQRCKYPSCTHMGEPGCAVKKAVEEGKISKLRFESYQKLFKEPSLQF